MIEAGTTAPDFTLPDQEGDDVSLSDFRGSPVVLALRLEIESDLSESGDPVALFQLPTAVGGQLDLVRVIVVDIIDKMRAAGQIVGRAEKFLAAGDADAAAGDFKKAYRNYGKAYRATTGGDGDSDSDDDGGDD